jgi:uncharacterized protein (DUF1330 family)
VHRVRRHLADEEEVREEGGEEEDLEEEGLTMPSIDPTPEQFQAFVQAPIEGPVRMLNLLAFAPDGGRESYLRYAQQALPHIERVGAKVIFHGDARATLIGEESWDEVLIVEYPSRQAFLDMVMTPEYQAITKLRTEGLRDSRLICTTPGAWVTEAG